MHLLISTEFALPPLVLPSPSIFTSRVIYEHKAEPQENHSPIHTVNRMRHNSNLNLALIVAPHVRDVIVDLHPLVRDRSSRDVFVRCVPTAENETIMRFLSLW